jgi:NDP-sugar pyrophosphorylase family protein
VKALLLAAGQGTRLRPLTADRPKPMVEIGGEPAIAHAMYWLRRQGVSDVAINLHYHPQVLREFVGDGSKFRLNVTYSVEREMLGTAGALRPLLPFFQNEDVFLVLYGDVLTNLELSRVLDAHDAAGPDATVVLATADDPSRAGIVAFNEDCRITRFVEKPPAGEVFSPWSNAGIYLCGPEVLEYVPAEGASDFARDVFPAMLRDGCHLLAAPTDALVIDFGSPDRLELAAAAMQRGAFGRTKVAAESC